MKKVLVRGPVINTSGYGVHARQVFKYLKNRGDCELSTHITPWGVCTYYINPSYENGTIGDILKSSKPVEEDYDVSFQIQLPNEWDSNLAKINVGVTAGVETTKCSKEWVDSVNKMDLVIVPSKFTKKCIEDSGEINTKVVVIPEYIIDEVIEEKLEPMDLNLETSFNFLMFGLITGNTPESDRKNTFYGIKWLCETFKDDPEVGIVIKTSLGRMTYIDRKNTIDILTKLLNEVRVGPYPKFYLSHGLMKSEEISSFYRSKDINALVSFTRGEGYGLPILEAAASGLPVMATKWSGHMDFMSKIKFSAFEYSLKDVHNSKIDNRIFVEGAQWAEVKEGDVKRRLKKMKSSYKVPLEWAAAGKEILRKELNSSSVFKIYDKYLENILT